MAEGVLPARALVSLKVLIGGYAVGILVTAVLTTLAVSTRAGTDLLSTLTSMFNPLPAIALLPLALLWFGLGEGGIIFVLRILVPAAFPSTLTGLKVSWAFA